MDLRDRPVHFSELSKIALSPQHYVAACQRELHDTAPMRFGRLVHTIVLGGPPSAVWDGERRGNAWKEFQAANEGREIVTRKEVDEATRVANAVMSDPVAAPYLVGRTEYGVEWSLFGRKCATRGIDILGDAFIADLKTTNCAQPDRFRRAALRMGYHAQLAMYRTAAESLGRRINEGILIAVETKPPYAVTVHRLREPALEEGAKILRLWMERLRNCEEANEWPGYAQDVLDFEIGEDFGLIIDGDEEVDLTGAAA